MVRRQSGSSEKVEVILDAAEALFLEHGYGGTSLAMVSTRARRAIGSIAHLVGEKSDLARAVHRRLCDAFAAAVGEAVKGRSNQSRDDQIRRVIETTRLWIASNAPHFRLIEALETHPLEHDTAQRRYGDRIARILAGDPDLNADVKEGERDAIRLFAFILGPVLARARLLPPSLGLDSLGNEETVTELVAAATAGLSGQSRSLAKAPVGKSSKQAEPRGDLFSGG